MRFGEAESSRRGNAQSCFTRGSPAGLQAFVIKPRQCGNHQESGKGLFRGGGRSPVSGFPSVGGIGDDCYWKEKKRQEFTF